MSNHANSSDVVFDAHLAGLFSASDTLADKVSILTALKNELLAETVVIDAERLQLDAHSAKVSTVLSNISVIETYPPTGGALASYVQYSTPGDETHASNGIGVMVGNGSVAGDGYIELDKANGTSYYYVCRMNSRRMRFKFRFTQTHSAMYMGLVIFNDTLTQYTTSKMVISKKMRSDEVSNPEELGRVLVHQTACSFRNGGVSDTIVNSHVYIMARMTTTGEGNPDNLDSIVEDHCDNESVNFIGFDDNSARDIQVGTEMYLYVSLTEEE